MSFLGELLIQLIGEAVGEALVGSKGPQKKLPEGEVKSSLGAMAAFFGTLGLVFGLLMSSIAVFADPTRDMGLVALLSVAGGGFAISFLGFWSGQKAPLVTGRHLGLATYGLLVSLPGMALSLIALVVGVAKALF